MNKAIAGQGCLAAQNVPSWQLPTGWQQPTLGTIKGSQAQIGAAKAFSERFHIQRRGRRGALGYPG